MTECEEVAESLRRLAPVGLKTMDEFRAFVRMHVDVSPQVIDNIAEDLWNDAHD